MTGLEKMKSQILSEARAQADDRIARARRQAEEILESAREEAAKSAAAISRKSDRDAADYREKTASSAELQKRAGLLAAKQEIIADVLEEAYRRLETMDTEAYFGMILKMIENYVLPRQGVIYFSHADMERMPEGFLQRVREAAGARGGSLGISGERENMGMGFILAYDGIEENCTWKAIFDVKRDELADKVQRLLF